MESTKGLHVLATQNFLLNAAFLLHKTSSLDHETFTCTHAPDLRRSQPQRLLCLGVVQLGVVQHRPDDLLHPRGAALGEGRDQDVVRSELEGRTPVFNLLIMCLRFTACGDLFRENVRNGEEEKR